MLRQTSRVVLVLGLATFAALKLATFSFAERHALVYLGVASLEACIAVLLCFRATSRLAAMICAAGFLGAGVVTLLLMESGGARECACLGVWQTTHPQALVMQGSMVVISGLYLASKGQPTSS